MAFPLWPLICFLLLPFTWAGPPSTGYLTPALQAAVPACAQTCLEFFVAVNFPGSTCGPPPHINCLCTTDSTTGLTIGEGALQCLASDCQTVDQSDALKSYGVCFSIPNSIPNTHGTLTATLAQAAYTTFSQTSFSISSSSQRSTSTPSFTTHSAAFTSTEISSTTSTSLSSIASPSVSESSQQITPPDNIVIISTTSTSTPTSSSSASAIAVSASAPVLSKPQIAGVAVSSVGAAAIAFGLCFFIYSMRRRKSNRRHSGSSFGGDKIIGSEESSPDMSAIATRDFGSDHHDAAFLVPSRQRSPTRTLRLETPASSSEDGWGQYQRDMEPSEIRVATRPQAPRSIRDEHSPITPASNRTRNSQLLPEKPSYSLFPSPLRATPRNSIPNQKIRPPGSSGLIPPVPPLGSPFARAAPQHPSSMDTSQAHLQGGRPAPDTSSDPFINADDRQPPNAYPYFHDSRPRPLPRSARRNTPTFRIPSWEQPSGVVRKPLPAYDPPRYQGLGSEAITLALNPKAATEEALRRKASRRKRITPRPMTHFSSGSETSFETLDDEDGELHDLPSTLSPVAEIRSPPPAGRVSYPAIPVSASESPTRNPRPPHPLPPDSLLSKRLGQEKAKEIAGRLKGSPQKQGHDTLPSAKWKVLVSPRLRGVERSGSPASARSIGKSPSSNATPWRR